MSRQLNFITLYFYLYFFKEHIMLIVFSLEKSQVIIHIYRILPANKRILRTFISEDNSIVNT
jgi:hypothetical protein